MKKWTIIDDSYGEDNSQDDAVEYSSTIKERIDYFINDAGTVFSGEEKEIRLIICEGDSWFAYSEFLTCVVKELKEHDVDNNNIVWGVVDISNSSDTLAEMLRNSDDLKTILRTYKQYIKCILLSASGNDIIAKLDYILNKNGVNQYEIKEAINSVKKHCQKMIKIIHKETDNERMPIFMHSYAYLCNFGECNKGIKKIFMKLFSDCPWIYSVAQKEGLSDKQTELQLQEIFDEFYKTIKTINGIIIADTRKSMQIRKMNETHLWLDEIHPNQTGSEKVARVYVSKIIKTNPNLLT